MESILYIWFVIFGIFWIILLYSIIKIYFITKEIKETWTLRHTWFFEYLIRDLINEDIKNKHESITKKAD